jgi:hypothetical protein
MNSAFSVFLLAGGLGAAVSFFGGFVLAHTLLRVFALGTFGLLLCAGVQASFAFSPLADPNAAQLFHAAANANALGWLAGTALVARLRAVEWLDALNAQETT